MEEKYQIAGILHHRPKKNPKKKSRSLDPENNAILSSIVTSDTISTLIKFRKKKASIFYTK
jgi:hypothetical protein